MAGYRGESNPIEQAVVQPFGASGPNHLVGLVPDPGKFAGTARYLCEDGLFKVPPGGFAGYDPTGGGSNADDAHSGGGVFMLSNAPSDRYTEQTATPYTVTATDRFMTANFAGSLKYFLPPAASYPGRWLHLRNIQAFTVVSDASDVVPLIGGAAGTAILAAAPGAWATLVSDGAVWQIMAAN